MVIQPELCSVLCYHRLCDIEQIFECMDNHSQDLHQSGDIIGCQLRQQTIIIIIINLFASNIKQ